MDAGIDFITPEFLNILFFQQKNLVLFPYTDLKHLHAFETFTVGHNLIDLESTALHNLKEIIESEIYNSYSQNPSMFLIYNLDEEKIAEIMKIEGVRCILNSNKNLSSLTDSTKFIFFNKKVKQFLNYDTSKADLKFERHLIESSRNQTVLHNKIQQIKTIASEIFSDYVENGNLDFLGEVLSEYPKKFWKKIIKFVELYFKIDLPEVDFNKYPSIIDKSKRSKRSNPFDSEYELIVNKNKRIAREFIQLLHDYRSKKVNPSNLELDQLYDPQKLYDYLRNHHWNEGIPQDFLEDWTRMSVSKYQLTDLDKEDFLDLLRSLKVASETIDLLFVSKTTKVKKKDSMKVPPVSDFPRFKQWFLKTLAEVEKRVFSGRVDKIPGNPLEYD